MFALPVWAGPAEELAPKGLENAQPFDLSTGTSQYNQLLKAINSKQRIYQGQFKEPEPVSLGFGVCVYGAAPTLPEKFKAPPPLRELSAGTDRPLTVALPRSCPTVSPAN